MGLLQQHAGTITGVLLRAPGAPVIQVFQAFEAILDQPMAGVPIQVGQHAHATGSMLVDSQPLLGAVIHPGDRAMMRIWKDGHGETPDLGGRGTFGTAGPFCAQANGRINAPVFSCPPST
ncbi:MULTISPECIES: hypothetical protein [unclassified Ectothiorhodospira]|uniref:hypothetical protein n=1 Tax=unclassified Ectothiorhodospira TaxID=2684909 RepID=UPI001EE87950|nr:MULTISPECIES: hypothetical protein [unclassified Ectothiorhodospira]MCG5514950.1 hypothetical protein [Ectothiorhodospira sp. 9100]MCG5517726.1 hypothetical protein [Ectothiorhodospira sp. 9905]